MTDFSPLVFSQPNSEQALSSDSSGNNALNRFDNRYISLPASFYTRQLPVPRHGTRLVDISEQCCDLLEIPPSSTLKTSLESLLAGRNMLPGMQPLAQKYTGHQFGYYNPDLGDGRGLLLGEWYTTSGQYFDWHLKGAGRTPYSRQGDGNAVLRSTVREYLVSEAMAALNIPTSRALAMAIHDESVRREEWEPAASMIRVAPSHIRFGHFEWLAHQGEWHSLKLLADFTCRHFFPECEEEQSPTLAMFGEIAKATAEMIAAWQAMGFVHGVMNTDNMSILGISFDYGPYAFQEQFHPDFNPNHSDTHNRYGFSRQPSIGMWNLGCLASAFVPLVSEELGDDETARDALSHQLDLYGEQVNQSYGERMRARLGLVTEHEHDPRLVGDFLSLLMNEGHDYHRAFRVLSSWNDTGPDPVIFGELGHSSALEKWLARYQERLLLEPLSHSERKSHMESVNPLYILRTHLLQEAITLLQENNDDSVFKRLKSLISDPFTRQPNAEYYEKPSEVSERICLSCSS